MTEDRVVTARLDADLRDALGRAVTGGLSDAAVVARVAGMLRATGLRGSVAARALTEDTPPTTGDQRPAWRDRHGDLWTEGDDGLMHTPETAPFPREHVEKKWGPLTLFRVLAIGDASPTEPRLENAAADFKVADTEPDCGHGYEDARWCPKCNPPAYGDASHARTISRHECPECVSRGHAESARAEHWDEQWAHIAPASPTLGGDPNEPGSLAWRGEREANWPVEPRGDASPTGPTAGSPS